jgi:RNA polymerase-interacting CarD/CdnL/TRCF family regulator
VKFSPGDNVSVPVAGGEVLPAVVERIEEDNILGSLYVVRFHRSGHTVRLTEREVTSE